MATTRCVLSMRGPVGGGSQFFGLVHRQGIDYRVVQGSDNTWTITFSGSEGLDWTQYQARGELRADFRDLAPEVLAAITVRITVADVGLEKQLFCMIPNSESDVLTAENGRFDIEIDNGTRIARIVSEAVWENSLQVSDA